MTTTISIIENYGFHFKMQLSTPWLFPSLSNPVSSAILPLKSVYEVRVYAVLLKRVSFHSFYLKNQRFPRLQEICFIEETFINCWVKMVFLIIQACRLCFARMTFSAIHNYILPCEYARQWFKAVEGRENYLFFQGILRNAEVFRNNNS